MVTYSPSYLAFTDKDRDLVVHVSSSDELSLVNKSISIVSFTPGKDSVSPKVCNLPSQNSFLSVHKPKEGYIINLRLTDVISSELRNCVSRKGDILALRIDFTQIQQQSSDVQLKQAAIIPLFDNSKGTVLTKERSQAVLGELQATLKIEQLSCAKRIIFSREEVICHASIQNASNYNVFGGIVISLREVLPPGATMYEKIERSNLLLVPGQTYTISFHLPPEKLVVLGNTISIHTTFSSIGEDTSGFTVTRESALYYIPISLIVATATMFALLSAILIRKLWIKFKK